MKAPKIGIHRWGTRVCFQPDRLSLPVLLWQLCLWHRPHNELLYRFFSYTSPAISSSFFFFSLTFHRSDWAWSLTATPFSLQVHLLPWLAGNYYPGDSSLFQESRGHHWVFVGHRVFLKFSEPDSPCEAAPGSDSAELLVRSSCMCRCQCCSHIHPLEPSSILWLKGGQRKGACFPS